MDANEYSKHHILQKRDGKEFLQFAADQLKWKSLSKQTVMDIGCGPGTNCPKLLIEKYPDLERVIGVDSNAAMINIAKKISAHPKIEYLVMDIENSFLKNFESKISKMVSIHCLHWIKDQQRAFNDIYNMLKPKGEAAFLFCLTCSFWSCLEEFIKEPKWKTFIENRDNYIPESHYRQLDASHYDLILKKAGFDVILCETVTKSFKFPTQTDFIGFIASICAFTPHIPPSKLDEFKEDLFQACTKCINNANIFYYKCIRILIRKP